MAGEAFYSESKLHKISLASIRAPRVGNERIGRADELYSHERKDRLRVLCVGKAVKVQINYERDIPMNGRGKTQDSIIVLVVLQ